MLKTTFTALLLLFACHSFASSIDIFSLDVNKQVKTMMQKHIGSNVSVNSIDTIAGGIHRVTITQKDQVRTFYLMPDLNQMIEGVLYTNYGISSEHPSERTTASDLKKNQRRIAFNSQQSRDVNIKTTRSRDVVESVDLAPGVVPKHLERPDLSHEVSNADVMRQLVSDGYHWSTGNSYNKDVYVTFDTLCSACRKLHKHLFEIARKYQINVHIIPILGFKPLDEGGTRASITSYLYTQDPENLEDHVHRATSNQSVKLIYPEYFFTPDFISSAENLENSDKLKKNTLIFRKMRPALTPMMFVRDSSGELNYTVAIDRNDVEELFSAIAESQSVDLSVQSQKEQADHLVGASNN